MLAEWSAECTSDDPVVVVPWQDSNGDAGFVDLRAHPYDFHHIPEAEQYPALMQALRVLNGPRSPVFTAKCDVWIPEDEELESLRLNLDEESSTAAGAFSYIDMLWRDRSIFASFPRHEQFLTRAVRLASALEFPFSMVEFVLRPAVTDFGTPYEGYAVTMYVKSVREDQESATEEWGKSLSAIVELLRRSDLAR